MSNTLLDRANKIVKDKKTGVDWVKEALPVMVDIAAEQKGIKATLADEMTPIKQMTEIVEGKYKPTLTALSQVDEALRNRTMTEYEETETINMENVGMAIFTSKPTFEVDDLSKVERKYLAIDYKAVQGAIDKGMRNIKGIKIVQKRTLVIRASKKKDEA